MKTNRSYRSRIDQSVQGELLNREVFTGAAGSLQKKQGHGTRLEYMKGREPQNPGAVSRHCFGGMERLEETVHDAETTLLESSSFKTVADTIYDAHAATLLDDEEDDHVCCILGHTQTTLDQRNISNIAHDAKHHVAETMLDDELEEISIGTRTLQSDRTDAEESKHCESKAFDNLDNLTHARQHTDADTISDASSTDVEIASDESPKTSNPPHGSSMRGVIAPSGWLHKRSSMNTVNRPKRRTRVRKSNIPAPMKQDWNLRHPSTWVWPAEAVSAPASKNDESKNGRLDVSRKTRVAKLKHDSRFQELRARIAQKNQALSPAVAETPGFESQSLAERMIATPLRRIDAIEKPPKYRHEVWFRKR